MIPATRTRVVVLLTAIGVALALLLTLAVGARAEGPATAAAAVSYTVTRGDTLWGIASLHVAPGDDVRVLVEDIRQANGLESSVIQPGQVLLIPVGG